MEYILPQGYLSQSAYVLWKTSRNSFYKKYFLREESFETTETRFGKQTADKLEVERDDGIIPYKTSEYNIKEEVVPGLWLLGRLDGFDEDTLKVSEIKTGHKNKAGKSPWDNVKVRKHKQLPFYCLLVQLKFGKYNPDVTLQWLETEFKKDKIEFDGHVLEELGKGKNLELTGYREIFDRHIEQWEIDNIKEDIILAAKEIHEAYEQFRKRNNK